MIHYLIKRCIKDYEQYDKPEVRTAYGILASVVGILCNVFLFAVKVTVGMLLKSISVTADAFNNLSDAASSVISFVGVKMASKPADEDHPFGHGRIEYIAAFVVSFLVIQVGFTFFKTSVGKIMNPEDIAFNGMSVCILAASVCVKLWMGFFNKKLGNQINSSVMRAASADAFGDVVTTLATIVSILVCQFSGFNIDGFIGLLVSLLVIWSGINIARDTLAPLIGQAIDPELTENITKMVEAYEGIIGTHDLIVHNYGPSKSMASIHAEVPNNVDIKISHEIIDKIEREVSKKLNVLLVIHMDPVETENEVVLAHKTMVEQVLCELDENLEFHDFRLVDGKQQINLIFDLVVPYRYTRKQQFNLLQRITEKIKEKDNRCQCVITLENRFTAEKNKEI